MLKSEKTLNIKGLIKIEDDTWTGGGYYMCPDCSYGYSFGAYFHADEWVYCPMCGMRLRHFKAIEEKQIETIIGGTDNEY